MRAFVTGGAGFIGGAVVRRLLAEGHDVTTLVRPGEAAPLLDGLPVTRIVGDLADLDALKRGAEGCDQVFHLAALYSFWGHPWEEFYQLQRRGHEERAADRVGRRRRHGSCTPAPSRRWRSRRRTGPPPTRRRPAASPTCSATTSAPSSWPRRWRATSPVAARRW